MRGVSFSENLPPPGRLKVHILSSNQCVLLLRPSQTRKAGFAGKKSYRRIQQKVVDCENRMFLNNSFCRIPPQTSFIAKMYLFLKLFYSWVRSGLFRHYRIGIVKKNISKKFLCFAHLISCSIFQFLMGCLRKWARAARKMFQI